MISNSQIKIIKSLRQKKFRVLHNQFIAEGDKTIIELIRANYKLCKLFSINPKVGKTTIELTQITAIELRKSVIYPIRKILLLFLKFLNLI